MGTSHAWSRVRFRIHSQSAILFLGDLIEARVIKVDKVERRIGLSIKAVGYSEEQLKKESASFESLRPFSEMVGLEQAFNLAAAASEEWSPGDDN